MGAERIDLGSGRCLGPDEPVLVVAEIGQNHNGRLDRAEALVDAAAWAGADAVKFVKRDLDCDLSSQARSQTYDSRHAFGRTYGEHRRQLELSHRQHARLCKRAERHGLIYFATVCDVPSALLMESLGAPLWKVASRDAANTPLLKFLATRRKPVMLSTGMSDLPEIARAVSLLERTLTPLVLLQCTSLYPTPAAEVHLRSMQTLASRFGTLVGFSDHTENTVAAVCAVALGAVVVEKHLTLDRQEKGTDHICSLEPEAFRGLVAAVRTAQASLGRADKPVPTNVAPVKAKLGRSLVARVPVMAGTLLAEEMLSLKCPGSGLSWLDCQQLVGRRAKRDIAADELLSWDDFD